MLLDKPDEVRHENSSGTACAIYGIDAHPTRSIFATAGGDNTVKIWSLEPHEDGIATFDLIATLSEHQQAVNCVRWAGHGRYLASGSDDQLVLLYEMQAGKPAPVPFGSKAKPNKENWVRFCTLKRHTMDVQDIAWSPDDRMLATCSIDNTILIWETDFNSLGNIMTQPLQVLTGHNGWVKGVAWDPVGKYLSSAGEDKTVKLWKVDDWQEAHSITEPFESCTSASHFRRLSWSPDGSAVCATHAFRSKQDVAALLNRHTWSNEVNFVGHRGVVTTVRFNGKLLVKKNVPDKEFACCAVGGDDATVSIWLAQVARPLAVVKDCFDASVTDLTWSYDGYTLLACSLDGTICCFQFNEEEIGAPITTERQSKLLQTKYGARAGITLASTLVENPLQLHLEEKAKTKATKQQPFSSADATKAGKVNTLVPLKKKDVVKSDISNGPAPGGQPKVNILVPIVKKTGEKKRRIVPTTVIGPANELTSSEQGTTTPSIPDAKPSADTTSLLDARMTGASISQPTTPKSATTTAPMAINSENGPVPKKAKSSDSPSKTKKSKDAPQLKRKRDVENKQRAGSASNLSSATTGTSKTREVTARQLKMINNSVPSGDSGGSGFHQILPDFPFRMSFSVQINQNGPNSSDLSDSLLIEITVHNIKFSQTNEMIELGPLYSTVKCTKLGIEQWVDRLPGRAVCAVGNSSFCAVGIADGSLFILSTTGRRLLPPLALGSAFSVMECSPQHSPFLLVILANGQLKVWNIALRKSILSESIEPIALGGITSDDESYTRKATLLRSQITTKGLPLVTFAVTTTSDTSKSSSSLQSFTFDLNLCSWLRIADDSFGYSDFKSSLPTEAVAIKDVPLGPLRRLQNASGYSRTQKGIASALLSEMSDPILQRNITRTHLEHQIAATISLKSVQEHQYWLQTYVKFLSSDEDVNRLEELCSDMMGPFNALSYPSKQQQSTGGTSFLNTWEPTILGESKRKLLKTTILPTMATNRTLQRLVNKYQLMLNDIEVRESQQKEQQEQILEHKENVPLQ